MSPNILLFLRRINPLKNIPFSVKFSSKISTPPANFNIYFSPRLDCITSKICEFLFTVTIYRRYYI